MGRQLSIRAFSDDIIDIEELPTKDNVEQFYTDIDKSTYKFDNGFEFTSESRRTGWKMTISYLPDECSARTSSPEMARDNDHPVPSEEIIVECEEEFGDVWEKVGSTK